MHNNDLSSLIKFHRQRAGLSQDSLAERAGVSRYVVQDLEAGNGRTTWSRLQAVFEILNLRLEPHGPLVSTWKEHQDKQLTKSQ